MFDNSFLIARYDIRSYLRLADRSVYIIDKTKPRQLPDVFELNISTNHRRSAKGHAWIVSLDAQNVLNQDHILV